VISNTAVDLGDSGWDPAFGHGRMDALAAVQLAADVETSDIVAPQVAVISPAANASVSGEVAVIVEASDAFRVAQVELLVDGSVVASEPQSLGGNQYRFAWDSTLVLDGSSRLGARTVDEAGNQGVAQQFCVSVSNTVDETAPTVTILSPGDGSSASRSVTLSARASDDQGSPQVSIYADGKLRCSGTGSVSCSWNLRKVSTGTHSISATARDAAGSQDSSSVEFTVEGSSGGGSNKGSGKGRKREVAQPAAYSSGRLNTWHVVSRRPSMAPRFPA
jgi:hypothetical protein